MQAVLFPLIITSIQQSL